MATLHEYLDINSSIKFIRDKLNTEFFLESNLFDLCVMGKIKPIIYYNGEIWVTPVKEQSYCQDDFNDINNSNFLDFEFSQLTAFMGYCYILHFGRDENSFDNIEPRHTIKIQNVIEASPIFNINKIGKLNKNYGTYLATIPKSGNHAFISNSFDIKDLIEIREKMDICKNEYEKYNKFSDKKFNLIYKFIDIKRNDLRFSINDLLDLIDKDFSILMKDIDKTKKYIIDLNTQLDQAHARIAELENIVGQSDEKELTANSKNSVSKLLYALMMNGDFELDGTKKGNLNDRLVSLTKEKGVPVTENFISNWLEYLNDKYYF